MVQQQTKNKPSTLPSKEATLFRSVVKFYESRQYKKGIKAADAILKKFPNHGETLAMKGLTLNCLNKKEEAYEYVRRGLKNDLKSHVCWHVYGLLYRSDREYNEAVKCYVNALRIDKDNGEILRDLALLQMHVRDIEAAMESWRRLLVLKPTQRGNWIGFAMGAHLSGDHSKACSIIDEYIKTLTGDNAPEKNPYEFSELLLYKNFVIEEGGNLQEALDNLEKTESSVVDKFAWKEKKAELLLKLNRLSEAEALYKELLALNTENLSYHKGLQKALQIDSANLTPEQQTTFQNLYDELQKSSPKSDAIQRIPLTALRGEVFASKLKEYVVPRLRKGIPSLFTDLKPLYADAEKVATIEKTLLDYLRSLEEAEKYYDAKKYSIDEDADKAHPFESPVVTMWTTFFLAQHYDNIGNSETALSFIDRAIKHTPTIIDLYIAKGRIYKHAGDLEKASDALEYARSLDLADRYLNTLSAKYLLRNNNIDKALEILSLFTRDSDEAMFYLMDMQSMNFSQEIGEAYVRINDLGRALKQFVTVHKHFEEIIDDQLDFHSYCLRKMTLRSYVKMLRFENIVQSHKYYVRSAKQAVKGFLTLHTKPAVKELQEDDPSLASMDPSERRKLLRKKKKEEEKKKAEQEKQQEQKEKKDPKKKPVVYLSGVDKDIQGQEYLDKENKLEEASKYLKVLQQFAKDDIEANLLAAEVYLLKKKYLKVVQALNRATSIDANHPQLHVQKIKFLNTVQPMISSLPAPVAAVLNAAVPKFSQGQALDKINADFLAKNSKSLAHRVAYAEAALVLNPANASEAKVITPESEPKRLEDFIYAFGQLSSGPLANPTLASSFRSGAHKLFPYSTTFFDENDWKQRKEAQEKQQQDK